MSGASIKLIKTHFPKLSTKQYDRLEQLGNLYKEWNDKVNLISRKDIDNIFDHHILHALSIRRYITFKAGTNVLDLGTGGGLPGLPLSICFPECSFHLVDARSKKIMVVNDMIERLGLQNVKATHIRAEEVKSKYEFIVCRAVAPVKQLLEWSQKLKSHNQINALPNGFILLKGGDVTKELKSASVYSHADIQDISEYYEDEYFTEKKIIYIQY